MSENSTPNLKVLIYKNNSKHIENVSENRKGSATYNFVPLNDQLILYSSKDGAIVDKRVFVEDMNSGVIECIISNKTPLHIGSGDGSEFFAPDGRIRIPGSSLRGMIRNYVNITSYGKMELADSSRKLYTRPMADEDKHFRKWYNSQLTTQEAGEKRKTYTALAGYLFRDNDGNYCIRPAMKKNGKYYKQVLKRDISSATSNWKLKDFHYYQDKSGGYFVTTGWAPKKKREWYINPPDNDAEPVILTDDDVQNYLNDCRIANPARKTPINLIDRLKDEANKFSSGIPIFYNIDDGVSFGHTGLFRIAYPKSIGDHMNVEHTSENYVSISERMFGRIGKENDSPSFSSHLRFGDALVVGNAPALEEKAILLASPKPTSFQNYLVQVHDNKNGKNHWGKGTPIRGIKQYWHHNAKDQDLSDASEKMKSKMKIIPAGTEFRFKINFDNLTDVELGALLTIINLPDGKLLKLGKGKSLGYGSVCLSGKLQLNDARNRYSSFFDADAWETGVTAKWDEETFTTIFQDFIHENVVSNSSEDAENFWELYRIRQFGKMLDFEKGNQLFHDGKLKSLGHTENRDRKILPLPEKV